MFDALKALRDAPEGFREVPLSGRTVQEPAATDGTVGIWNAGYGASAAAQQSVSAEDADATVGSWFAGNQTVGVPNTYTQAQPVYADPDATVGIWKPTPQKETQGSAPAQAHAKENAADDAVAQKSQKDALVDAKRPGAAKGTEQAALSETKRQNTELPKVQEPKDQPPKPERKRKKFLPFAIAGTVVVVLALILVAVFAGIDSTEALGKATTPAETSTTQHLQETTQQNYERAIELMNDGRYREAAVLFMEINDYKDSFRYLQTCCAVKETISAGQLHNVAVKNNGSPEMAGAHKTVSVPAGLSAGTVLVYIAVT